jgi:hypothetical protein
VALDGFIGPAHVSTVIGSRPYEFFAEEYRKPVVIAGFEPLDVMQAILMLVRQVNEGRAEVENEFTRAVTPRRQPQGPGADGDVFELRESFEWRGLGEVPRSALRIREAYAAFDAERRFGLDYQPGARPQGLRMRRHPARREAPDRLQAVRHRVHARRTRWAVHGVLRGRLRGALHLRPLPRPRGHAVGAVVVVMLRWLMTALEKSPPAPLYKGGSDSHLDRRVPPFPKAPMRATPEDTDFATLEQPPARIPPCRPKAYARPLDMKHGHVDMSHGAAAARWRS